MAASDQALPATEQIKPRRNPWPVRIGVVVVAAAAVWFGWSLLTPVQGYERSLPDITLERLEGGELKLTSLTGQPVIINMWATWCLPCIRELPMLAETANREPGITFLFADQGESRDVVQKYLDERPEMSISGVLLDRNQALAVEFETLGLPMTLFFDAQGNHVHSHVGEVTTVEMFNYVNDLKRGQLNPL